MLYKQAFLRLKWLDIAKGIAIILMVIGHTSIPDIFSRFIFAFHMPLFFIASGWTTNWGKYSFMVFAKSKFKSIMVPFIIYSLIVLSVQTILIGGGNIYDWLMYGWQGYALWFIPVLFVASILGRLIHIVHSSFFHYVMMTVFVFLGFLLKRIDLYLPWTLCSVPLACFFVLLGTELKKIQYFIVSPRLWLFAGCFIMTFVISHFWKLDMAWNNVIPVLPLILGAVAGSVMLFSLSSYIERYTVIASKVLSNIGKETFVIVAFSQLIIMLLRRYTLLHSATCYLLLIVILTIIITIKKSIKRIIR